MAIESKIITGAAVVAAGLALLADNTLAQPSFPSRHYGLVNAPIGTSYKIGFIKGDTLSIILKQDTVKQLPIGIGYDDEGIPTRMNPADSSLGGMSGEAYSFFINSQRATPDLIHNPGGLERIDLNVTGVFENPVQEQFINSLKIMPNPGEHFLIRYSLGKEYKVNLSIYNLLGQRIITLIDEKQVPGNYDIFWDGTAQGRKLPNSTYFYRLDTGTFSKTGKLTLLR